MVCEQASQLGSMEAVQIALLVYQGDQTFIRTAVKAAVTDKVKDMPGTTPHRPLEGTPGLPSQPGQVYDAIRAHLFERFFDPLLFAFYIQRREVAWAGNHPQNPQGERHRERLDRLGQFQVADHRRI